MFLNKKYILSNELVDKMGIHIANISMIRQQFEDNNDFGSIVKMNNCSFINITCNHLPNNIKNGILNNTFTDMSDKLPCTFVKSEYNVTENELFRSGIVIDKVTIASKDFYVFNQEFIKKMRNKLGYVLNKKELDECIKNNEIDGFEQISKNKFFVWY